jgi:cell division transport system permease protein
MKLSRNRTGYYIKEGVTSIFAHSLMSFASVCIIIAFLVIMGSFILLAVNISAIVGELENENIILAYVHENLNEVDARALGPLMRSTPNVSEVRFISREEAMVTFLGPHEGNERFRDVDPTWFRHRYQVFVNDVALIGETQMALRDIYGVASVNANLTIARGLVTVRNIVRGVSAVIVGILLAISLFIMSNTIKLATFERREEIAIMRVVGATNAFIRWPFVYEGFILSTIGSMSAYAILWGLYNLVVTRVLEYQIGFVSLIPFSSISLPVFIAFASIGFCVGVGGSGFALNRYLKV